MSYVDGFVVPILKKNLPAYRAMARKCGKIWREYGALDFRENLGDDLDLKWCTPFTKMIKLKPGETVLFSYIVYKSRAHRDKIGAQVMKDPRLAKMMSGKDMPFDCKRMVSGGFKTIVKV